jgi:hypothetical protein
MVMKIILFKVMVMMKIKSNFNISHNFNILECIKFFSKNLPKLNKKMNKYLKIVFYIILLIIISIPKWYLNEESKKNLFYNQKKLITTMDLNQTLKRIINNNIESENKNFKRNLFSKIENRKCSELNVDEFFCICSPWIEYDKTKWKKFENKYKKYLGYYNYRGKITDFENIYLKKNKNLKNFNTIYRVTTKVVDENGDIFHDLSVFDKSLIMFEWRRNS